MKYQFIFTVIYFFFLFLILSYTSFIKRKNLVYDSTITPIEISNSLYIFSSIIDKQIIRILLFYDKKNESDALKYVHCIYKGKIYYSYKGILKKYISVHNKYYNLICQYPQKELNNLSLYISNKHISLYNNHIFDKKYNLLMCLTTLFSFNNKERIIEFIEYYKFFGVDKFIIYNTNCSKEILNILEYYKRIGIMDIYLDNFTHTLYEKKRFHLWKHNDCFHKYKYKSKRIIITDIDEIIYSPLYNKGKDLLMNLSNIYSVYYFYPKLTITNGRGFFLDGYYSICPNKLWKYLINIPRCVVHLNIHHVIIKRQCKSRAIPLNIAYVLHARNEKSYHAKACKTWKFENNYTIQRYMLNKIIKNIKYM